MPPCTKVSRKYLVPLMIIGTLAACTGDSKISSDQVSTSQIFATFQVVSDGSNQIHAEAQLTRDYPPGHSGSQNLYISLTANDQLWLSTGDLSFDTPLGSDLFSGLKQLNNTHAELNIIKEVRYSFLLGVIRTDGDRYAARMARSEDNQYQISLLRNHYTDAPDSHVVLPLDFTLHAPMSGESYSRSSDVIHIEWAPTEPDTSVTLEVKTSCPGQTVIAGNYTQKLNQDTGLIVLDAGALELPTLEGSCSSTINLIRTRLGEFDSRFTGGHVAGHQIRTRSITTHD